MSSIPYADADLIHWQARDKEIVVEDHVDLETLVSQYPINPHLLYSGEFVASLVGLSGGHVNYFEYITRFREIDPHPLISLRYLSAFGCDTSALDVFSILKERPHLFGCLSPLVSHLFCDVVGNTAISSEDFKIPPKLYAYLVSGHMRNFPSGFGASLLVPDHFHVLPFSTPHGISEIIPDIDSRLESPTVSVLVPLYNTKEHHLRALISSLYSQTIPSWQLILYDDGSHEYEHIAYVNEMDSSDPRIRFVRSWVNRGISDATNRALQFCTGEYVLFVDHDDMLHPSCLAELSQKAEEENADIVYADHILVSECDQCIRAFKKNEWDPILFMQVMYICHPLLVRSSLLEGMHLDPSYNKIQDFEFALRLSLLTSNIAYVPTPLYYWRAAPGSFALSSEAKGDISVLHLDAMCKHIHRLQLSDFISAAPNKAFPHRLRIEANPEIKIKISDYKAFVADTSKMQSEPAFMNFLEHLDRLCVERAQELFCVNHKQFLIASSTELFFSVALLDLIKWHCMPDVAISSFAQVSPQNFFIAHGYELGQLGVKPMLSGTLSDQDDGTGIPISDRCVPVCNPTHLCIDADFLFESFQLLKRFLDPTSLDFDSICIFLSLCALSNLKRNVSLVSDFKDDIIARPSYQLPPEKNPLIACFWKYLQESLSFKQAFGADWW